MMQLFTFACHLSQWSQGWLWIVAPVVTAPSVRALSPEERAHHREDKQQHQCPQPRLLPHQPAWPARPAAIPLASRASSRRSRLFLLSCLLVRSHLRRLLRQSGQRHLDRRYTHYCHKHYSRRIVHRGCHIRPILGLRPAPFHLYSVRSRICAGRGRTVHPQSRELEGSILRILYHLSHHPRRGRQRLRTGCIVLCRSRIYCSMNYYCIRRGNWRTDLNSSSHNSRIGRDTASPLRALCLD